MTTNETVFKKIDSIIEKVKAHKVEPDFTNELTERINRKPPKNLSDDELLRVYAILLAFSQGANSEFVRDRLVLTGDFDKIFQNFSVDKVAKMDAEELKSKHWAKPLTYIRMKSKVDRIIDFARKIKEHGSLSKIFTNSQIPKTIQSNSDIATFWKAFDELKALMKEREISYLQSTTTLLHYLLDTGYDCIKPDSAVMGVAERIGIVDNKAGDRNLRKTVNTLLEYSVARKLRPSEVDLYFLIAKPQEGAKKYVHKEFYSHL